MKRESVHPSGLSVGLVGLGLGLLGACERDALYAESDFTENVAEAFSDCNESEIRFLAGKHNLQTAFGRCGSNNFANVAWSPDGETLHFRLSNSIYQLKVAEKSIAPVLPTDVHVHNAAWQHKDQIVLPIARGEPNGADPQLHLATYNFSANTLNYQAIDAIELRDLQAWSDEQSLLVLARRGDEEGLRPYRVDPGSGTMERVFPFLEQPVERLAYAPAAGLLAWSSADATELMRDTGESVAILAGVRRAIPHPEGRYVILEAPGEPISPFDQRAWNELSPEARERELARQQQFVERLPDWAPREAIPPELQILDLETQHRYRIAAFYGDEFVWYSSPNPRARFFGSFMLWGIEGKQLNRNVAITDLAERLRMLGNGELPTGFERMSGPTGVSPAEHPPSPASPESPEAPAP